MSKNSITSTQLLELAQHQLAGTKEVMAIGCVGQNRGLEIKRTIKEKLEKEGYFLPKNLVPMSAVIEYFKMDLDYLIKLNSIKKGGLNGK